MPPAPAGVRSTVPAWVLASGLDQPDDLWYQNGATYVGQLGSGHVATVLPGVAVSQSAWTVPMAEGIALLGDRMFVADQRNDRVDEIVNGRPQTFLQLQPVSGKDNVDGIGVQGDQLLVPDSPNGNLLWVDGSGRITRTVGGFNRPTGAWPLSDGSVLVADEYGNAAFKVAPDGGRTVLVQGLPIVDDVAADAQGHVFVITPVTSGGRLAELVGGRAIDLAGNLLQPQGLGFDGAGNVLVSETSANRLDVFIRNFKLIPTAGPPAAGQPVCVHLLRSPGFSGDVQLLPPDGGLIVRQPGIGDVGEVLFASSGYCGQPGCFVTATSGALTDTGWITG
ncbi:MAG TPA: hypothetical protein VIP52_02005 [Candidatus Dormibacteraeota bacterium]